MLNRTDREQRCNTVGARLALALIAYVAFGGSQAASAQQEGPSPSVELGIIVTSTAEEAEKVIKDFKAGTDFGVLAKEQSIDSTADDGGYLGRLSAAQLQPELRDAVSAIKAGQISAPFRMSNGFAVVTILSAAPQSQNLTDRNQLN